MPHWEILAMISSVTLPCAIHFANRGVEYDVAFHWKPLGFSITKHEHGHNAKLCSITSHRTAETGIAVDSYLMSVNGVNTWGVKHESIIAMIKKQQSTINCVFRTVKLFGHFCFFWVLRVLQFCFGQFK